jgi:hypothetical protein
MDVHARGKLILELTTERDQQNAKAAELERQATLSKSGDERTRLQLEARGFREGAREVNRRLDELRDTDIHDDDRGGIER